MLQSPRATRFIYLHTYWVRGTDSKWEGAGSVGWEWLGLLTKKRKKKKLHDKFAINMQVSDKFKNKRLFFFAHCVGSNTVVWIWIWKGYISTAASSTNSHFSFLFFSAPPTPPPPPHHHHTHSFSLPPDHQDSVLLSGGRQARRATHSRSINRLSLMRDTEGPRGRSPDSLSLQNTHAKIYSIISEPGKESCVLCSKNKLITVV